MTALSYKPTTLSSSNQSKPSSALATICFFSSASSTPLNGVTGARRPRSSAPTAAAQIVLPDPGQGASIRTPLCVHQNAGRVRQTGTSQRTNYGGEHGASIFRGRKLEGAPRPPDLAQGSYQRAALRLQREGVHQVRIVGGIGTGRGVVAWPRDHLRGGTERSSDQRFKLFHSSLQSAEQHARCLIIEVRGDGRPVARVLEKGVSQTDQIR